MDVSQSLTPLDPAFVRVMRIGSGIIALLPLAGAAALEFSQLLPPGVVLVPALLLIGYIVWMVPQRRYNRWAYDVGEDRLRIMNKKVGDEVKFFSTNYKELEFECRIVES